MGSCYKHLNRLVKPNGSNSDGVSVRSQECHNILGHKLHFTARNSDGISLMDGSILHLFCLGTIRETLHSNGILFPVRVKHTVMSVKPRNNRKIYYKHGHAPLVRISLTRCTLFLTYRSSCLRFGPQKKLWRGGTYLMGKSPPVTITFQSAAFITLLLMSLR